MQNIKQKNLKSLKYLIGNTPLLEIHFLYKGEERKIYAKAEHMNLTGSIKDRMAHCIIRKSYESGSLNTGDHIAEATSGNTGIAIAAIGRALGHPVTIFMPDWMSTERKNLIKSLGAEVILVSKEEGGFLGSIEKSETFAEKNGNVFLPRQFSNYYNADAHYESTGPEIWSQLSFRSIVPNAFVAGVGTGGTVMGTGKYLKEKNPDIKIHPLEPANSPTLSTGYKIGKHRIQGISDEFIPQIVKLDELDSIVSVDDGDAIIMSQKFARDLGLAVGISSGANFIGALKIQNESGRGSNVITVFSDDNKKYLSTDLLKDEPVKDGFLSSDCELLYYRAFKRVCSTCCNPEDCVEDGAFKFDSSLPKCIRR